MKYDDNNPDNLLWLTGKYLRINAEQAGLNLWEVIVRNEAGEEIPLTLYSHTGGKDVLETGKPPENLIDEPGTLEGEPGWFNGTYFDEIYHARTAYEHLHGIAPYETTHPPLGKLMMSVGIAIFGMTPFGWRFMGALVGVLMLPALYLLAKQLTKRRDMATFAMLLFAFDLMHFTQTRIATIDSFPVLFILLSVLCMVRYLQTDVFAIPAGIAAEARPKVITKAYLRTLIPLALSGFFMGVSIASKWIGLYSAVGLAVLFFIAAYRQFRTGLVAYDLDKDDVLLTPIQQLRVLWARELTLKRILVTCGFCVLFFIAVPAAIYYLSYIPYLSPTGPVTIDRIVKAQIGMYNYQSTPGLGMDHPFYSPWYGYRPYWGGWGYRPYWGRSAWSYGWYDPFFDQGYDSYTVYTSGISLKIDRKADGQRLFEGKAEAVSTSNRLQHLVPNLVEATFTDFPGNSGETVRISVAPEKKRGN